MSNENKTRAALAVGLGAIAVVGLGAYWLGSKKSDPFDPFRVTSPPGYRTWKFDTDRGHVKIQHPAVGKGNERDVESVLARYPPGSYSLAGVKARLADIGAKFVPWAGGEPGDTGFWDEIDLDQMKAWKARREHARGSKAGTGILTFNDLKAGDRFQFAGGKTPYIKTEFDKYVDGYNNGGDANDLYVQVVKL